jgi:hypothetical protein
MADLIPFRLITFQKVIEDFFSAINEEWTLEKIDQCRRGKLQEVCQLSFLELTTS